MTLGIMLLVILLSVIILGVTFFAAVLSVVAT